MAARTVWHLTMSLDGFMADKHGTLDWMPTDAGGVPMGMALISQIGAVLAGRRTYDDGIDQGGAGPYGGAFTGRVFVLTHRREPTPLDPQITFVVGTLAEALDAARRAAGERAVVLFGASIGQQCLAAGELDEVLVHIAPVLIGSGTPTFAGSLIEQRFDVLERSERADLTTLRLAPRIGRGGAPPAQPQRNQP